jgi:hypothetical protein
LVLASSLDSATAPGNDSSMAFAAAHDVDVVAGAVVPGGGALVPGAQVTGLFVTGLVGGIVVGLVALGEVGTVVVVGDGVGVEDSVVAPGVGVWACAVPREAMKTIMATAVSRAYRPLAEVLMRMRLPGLWLASTLPSYEESQSHPYDTDGHDDGGNG